MQKPGSAQFLLLGGLGDSLAGRAYYQKLYPVTVHEAAGAAEPPLVWRLFGSENPHELFQESARFPPWDPRWLRRGMFPELVWNASLDPAFWLKGYEATYLERDLRGLAPGIDPLTLQRFLRIAAARNGQLLNQASIAGDAGIAPTRADEKGCGSSHCG